GGRLEKVGGQDAVAAPGCGAFAPSDEAAIPAVSAFEVADAAFAAGSPFDQVAELGCVLKVQAGLARPALARDDHGLHAELFELLVNAGLAVAAIGGDLFGSAAESLVDTFDRRGELLGVGRVAGLDLVVEDQPILVVHDLGLGPELDRLAEAALLGPPCVRLVPA